MPEKVLESMENAANVCEPQAEVDAETVSLFRVMTTVFLPFMCELLYPLYFR